MSILMYRDVYNTPVSCFANTLEDAKALAEEKSTELRELGNYTTLARGGDLVNAGFWIWDVYIGSNSYHCLGATKAEAKSNAEKMVSQLSKDSGEPTLASSPTEVPAKYGWNVLLKKKLYK